MDLRRVYVLPFSNTDLNNVLFKDVDARVGGYASVFHELRDYLFKKGIELNTIDCFDFEHPEKSATLLVLNHPGDTLLQTLFRRVRAFTNVDYRNKREFFLNYKKYLPFFSKKILYLWECPVVMPSAFSHQKQMMRLYSKIYSSVDTGMFNHFFLPQSICSIISELFGNTDRKYLTLINGNKTAFGRSHELYSERLRAIQYFSDRDFDLFGMGWDRPMSFFYKPFSKFIHRCYRGGVKEKYLTLSKYRFAICYENAKYNGYITEKIFDCLAVGTIPIYYGAPDIEKYVPRECFVDFRRFSSYEELDSFLMGMTEKQVASYREAAREYIDNSSQFKLFSVAHFGDSIIRAISNDVH